MTLDYVKVIHFFFPPSDDELLLQRTSVEQFISLAEPERTRNYIHLLPYNEPPVKAAIHLNKYHYHTAAQQLLAAVLAKHLNTIPTPTYLVPIPLSGKRLRQRGYNQVHEVLKWVSLNNTEHTLSANLLYRTRNTTPQTTLLRTERLKNMRGAFAVPKRQQTRVAGAHIILLDDVYTTGATFTAARLALLSHKPASVHCIALAH